MFKGLIVPRNFFRITVKSKIKVSFLSVVFALLGTQIFGHGVWIEVANKGQVGKEATVHLYFGELNHGIKEEGLKWYAGDMFKDYKAFVKHHAKAKPALLNLSASATSLSAQFTPKDPGIYQLVAVNDEGPVRDLTKYGLGFLKEESYLRTTFEATSYRKKQEGALDLAPMAKYDIVPFPAKNGYGSYDSHMASWRVGESVHATFYKAFVPAGNQEIKITSPDGWAVIKKTNKEGVFSFTPYRKGVYQVLYESKKTQKGNYKGKTYDTYRIRATTLVQVN